MNHRARTAMTVVATMAVAMAAAVATAPPGRAEAPSETVQPEKSGFAVSIIGAMEGMEPRAFAETVVGAFPPDLLDPKRNFTTHDAYDPKQSYRIVLAFHDGRETVAADLCAEQKDATETVDRAKPDFKGLWSTVAVTAALCEGGKPLARAENRSAGSMQPQDASFRFLVADTVKDLFPDGLSQLPRASVGAAR